MRRTTRPDLWIWICIAAVILATRLYPTFVPELEHDSFQYLSAADNVLAGRFGYTSLIHYDVERSFGVIPAPLMTFPAGYSVAIALLSLTGVSAETAALILSAASLAGCITLLVWLGTQLGLSRGVRNVVIACFVFNGIVSEFASAVLSESLFMFLILLGVASLVAGRRRDSGAIWFWVAAGVAWGAAYFVRYAGLFFVVGLTLLVVLHAVVLRERRLAIGHAVALAVSGLFVTAGIVRNLTLVGNWRGRDEMVASNPLLPALAQTGRALNALFLGSGTASGTPGGTFIPKALLCASLVLGLGLLAWHTWRARSRPATRSVPTHSYTPDLLVLAGSYAACMLYAGLTSEISYGSARNFVPLVPLLLLLFGLLLDKLLSGSAHTPVIRRICVGALLVSLASYLYLNMLVIRKPPINRASDVAARFGPGGDAQTSPRAALLERIGPSGVVLATDGQAVGHVLGRPTLSMTGPTFSRIVWDEDTVRATVQRFHVAAIVVLPPAPGQTDVDDLPSPFVRRLAQGSAPDWLTLAYRSSSLLAYVPAAAAR